MQPLSLNIKLLYINKEMVIHNNEVSDIVYLKICEFYVSICSGFGTGGYGHKASHVASLWGKGKHEVVTGLRNSREHDNTLRCVMKSYAL